MLGTMPQRWEGHFQNSGISPGCKGCLSSFPCGQHCPWLSESQENFSASSLWLGQLSSKQTEPTGVQHPCMSRLPETWRMHRPRLKLTERPVAHSLPSWFQDYITELAFSLKQQPEGGCPTPSLPLESSPSPRRYRDPPLS